MSLFQFLNIGRYTANYTEFLGILGQFSLATGGLRTGRGGVKDREGRGRGQGGEG